MLYYYVHKLVANFVCLICGQKNPKQAKKNDKTLWSWDELQSQVIILWIYCINKSYNL